MISKLLARALLAVMPLSAMAFDNNKPIEWVVGYAAGGGSDVVARMLADAMGKRPGMLNSCCSVQHTQMSFSSTSGTRPISGAFARRIAD